MSVCPVALFLVLASGGVDRFGDPLPPGAVARLGTIRLRHAQVTSLGFADRGRVLVSCGMDGWVRWWDLFSGRAIRQVRAAGPDANTDSNSDSGPGRRGAA